MAHHVIVSLSSRPRHNERGAQTHNNATTTPVWTGVWSNPICLVASCKTSTNATESQAQDDWSDINTTCVPVVLFIGLYCPTAVFTTSCLLSALLGFEDYWMEIQKHVKKNKLLPVQVANRYWMATSTNIWHQSRTGNTWEWRTWSVWSEMCLYRETPSNSWACSTFQRVCLSPLWCHKQRWCLSPVGLNRSQLMAPHSCKQRAKCAFFFSSCDC